MTHLSKTRSTVHGGAIWFSLCRKRENFNLNNKCWGLIEHIKEAIYLTGDSEQILIQIIAQQTEWSYSIGTDQTEPLFPTEQVSFSLFS